MKKIICIDRDGTLIYDTKEHLFLGCQTDWKEKVNILPTVVEGIKKLHELEDVRIYMITNQSGVAVKELPLLTEKKAEEVCQYIMEKLAEKGAVLDGFFICPHADQEYFKTHPQFTPIHKQVCSCECIKPAIGMVKDALEKENINIDEASLYVIGDRASDVQTGISAGGQGILIPFDQQPGEKEKIVKLHLDKVTVAEDLIHAADSIIEYEHRKHTK